MGKILFKVLKFLLSRPFWSLILVALQLAIIIVGPIVLSVHFFELYLIFMALSMIVVVYVLHKRDNPTYKMAWIIPILMFPVFGGLLYLLIGNRKAPKRFKSNIIEIRKNISPTYHDDSKERSRLAEADHDAAREANYLHNCAMAPMYTDTLTDFQAPGEAHFQKLLEAIESAERYIFMEYFIVNPGKMLDTIVDLLGRKAQQGLDVRFIYDDFGSLMTVPNDFVRDLEERGVKAICFNRVHGYLRAFMNFRNHRKITVIDGRLAFTGGVNLADEYINERERFGYWRDSAIAVEGSGAWTLTCLFLETWNSIKNLVDDDLERYRPDPRGMESRAQLPWGDAESLGCVTPFGDSPFDDEPVGENLYRIMISHAIESVCIMTPYFIVDNEIITALEIAAHSGVRVRIIVPHIPDKKLAFQLTQSHYRQLLEAGIEVLEYTPGFIHTKACIIDGVRATNGTINFDYRSLYLHFECGVWMYKTPAVRQLQDEFELVYSQSEHVTLEQVRSWPWHKRTMQAILKFLAPLF